MFNKFFALALLSSSSFAADYSYKCFSYFWNGYDNEKGTMSLVINAKHAKADIIEESWDEKIGGDHNINYRSRGNVKYLKYGYNLIVEESLVNGGKILSDGSRGGFARVEGQAEGGFYQYKFVCKKN